MSFIFFVVGLVIAFLGLNGIFARIQRKSNLQIGMELGAQSPQEAGSHMALGKFLDAVAMPEILLVGGLIISAIGVLGYHLKDIRRLLHKG